MRCRLLSVRGFVGLIAGVSLLALAAPAATAATDQHDSSRSAAAFRMVAKAQHRTTMSMTSASTFGREPSGTSALATSASGTDPTDDNPSGYDSRGDIVSFSLSNNGSNITTGVVTATFDNPTSANWSNYYTGPLWVIDTNADGYVDYDVLVINDGYGNVIAGVLRDSDYAYMCSANPTWGSGSGYAATFPVGCIGNPSTMSMAAGFEYDTSSTSSWDTTSTIGPVEPADTKPPTGVAITAPTKRITLSASFTVRWTATDPSGISHYTVQRRVLPYDASAGSWSGWQANTTAKSAPATGSRGSSYCFRVRATDTKGNTSAYSSQFCTAIPLRSDQLGYSSGWTKRSNSGAYGGFYYQSRTQGNYATRTHVQAKRLYIVATTCSVCGKLTVKLGSSTLKTINLESSSTHQQKVFPVVIWSSTHTGTVKIVVASSTGRYVKLEGLGIYRD